MQPRQELTNGRVWASGICLLDKCLSSPPVKVGVGPETWNKFLDFLSGTSPRVQRYTFSNISDGQIEAGDIVADIGIPPYLANKLLSYLHTVVAHQPRAGEDHKWGAAVAPTDTKQVSVTRALLAIQQWAQSGKDRLEHSDDIFDTVRVQMSKVPRIVSEAPDGTYFVVYDIILQAIQVNKLHRAKGAATALVKGIQNIASQLDAPMGVHVQETNTDDSRQWASRKLPALGFVGKVVGMGRVANNWYWSPEKAIRSRVFII